MTQAGAPQTGVNCTGAWNPALESCITLFPPLPFHPSKAQDRHIASHTTSKYSMITNKEAQRLSSTLPGPSDPFFPSYYKIITICMNWVVLAPLIEKETHIKVI